MRTRKVYAIWSPRRGGHFCTFGFSTIPALVRKNAVKFCTVHSGAAPYEDWRTLYRQGYRIVRCVLTRDVGP